MGCPFPWRILLYSCAFSLFPPRCIFSYRFVVTSACHVSGFLQMSGDPWLSVHLGCFCPWAPRRVWRLHACRRSWLLVGLNILWWIWTIPLGHFWYIFQSFFLGLPRFFREDLCSLLPGAERSFFAPSFWGSRWEEAKGFKLWMELARYPSPFDMVPVTPPTTPRPRTEALYLTLSRD